MKSLVHLFNTAMSRLGGEQLPQNRSALEEDTNGLICLNVFPHVLDATLATHDWGFARRRVILALKSETVPQSYAYRFRYSLPADCLRPLRIFGQDGGPALAEVNRSPAFLVEGDAILSNVERAEFSYIARVEEPKLWPPLFAEALVWAMAGELCSARQNDTNKQMMCLQRYEAALAAAKAWDRGAGNPHRDRSAWLAARGYRAANRIRDEVW